MHELVFKKMFFNIPERRSLNLSVKMAQAKESIGVLGNAQFLLSNKLGKEKKSRI